MYIDCNKCVIMHDCGLYFYILIVFDLYLLMGALTYEFRNLLF